MMLLTNYILDQGSRLKCFGFMVCFLTSAIVQSQDQIGDFTSIEPTIQGPTFVIPSSHAFQYIIETGDSINVGDTLLDNNDFTGYVPINNSSKNGYLSINSESFPGGVTVLDINLDSVERKWNTTYSEALDFSAVGGTRNNCSGGITPWGTVITCEEYSTTIDDNNDGYNDFGWAVEIDPVNKTVLNKLWAAGNFNHENAAIHSNQRTLYQGSDSYPGFLYKYVADVAGDLSSGLLYVYVGPKNGNGNWVLLDNTTQLERNTTLNQSFNVGATEFLGVEDVEIGPDGKIYMAVSFEGQVYRFDDPDPISGTTVTNFETFVGDMDYDIAHENGVTSIPWGFGNDNLCFDGEGNLWVFQDGGNYYIWVVGPSHTQVNPNVEIFGIAPDGSEPTGITFTPDYKYLMMSIQHPLATNNSQGQLDAFGDTVYFDKSVSIVVALDKYLGPCPEEGTACDDGDTNTLDDVYNADCNCEGTPVNTTINSCFSISEGSDDAEEYLNNNNISLFSDDLELVNDAVRGDQLIGLRFTEIQVPQGAIITEAYIQFTTDEISSSATSLTIAAQDITDAEEFENINSNISARTKTPSSLDVAWSPPAWENIGENGADQQTPDLKNIVQYLIDKPDYSKGNAIAFILSGTGRRTAESYDGSAMDAPVLCIEYKLCHTDLILDSSMGDLFGTFEAINSITLSGPINILPGNILHLKAPQIYIQNEINISQDNLMVTPLGCVD